MMANGNKPVISVILPVYNTDKRHLEECFESIQEQTLQNYEVIVVDDGSKKTIADQLDSYVRRLNNWSVHHQKNQGVSAARNNGFELAIGDYVFFLDAGDVFKKDFFQEMHDIALRNDADIVTCWFDFFDDKTGRCTRFEHANKKAVDKIPNKESYNWRKVPNVIYQTTTPNPWSKLFKKSFLIENRLHFNEKLFRAQDLEFTARALVCAEVVALVDKSLILYRVNTGTSNTDKRLYPLASYQAVVSIAKFLKSKNIYKKVHKSFSEQAAASIWFHLRDSDPEFIDNYDKLREFIKSLDLVTVKRSEPENTLVLNNKTAADYFRSKYEKVQAEKDALELELSMLREQNIDYRTELDAFLGIKRSTRLLAGNIARRTKLRR